MKEKILMIAVVIALMTTIGCKKPEPIACFTLTQNGSNVTVDANCSTDTQTYLWEFGDGTTGIASKVTHQYSTPGSYSITLQVTGEGGSATKTQGVDIANVCKTCTCNSSNYGSFSNTYCGTIEQVNTFCSSGCTAAGWSCGCN